MEVLASVDVATRGQITDNFFDTTDPTRSQRRQTQQILKDLKEEGYVRELEWFKPVYGLTAKGVELAKSYDLGDPKELKADRSPLVMGHEIARTKRHFQIERYFREQGWRLGWQKTDLYRADIEPDDLLTKTVGDRTSYFFLEREEEKKTFENLYWKALGYYDIFNKDKCLKQWGFRTFNVIFDFREKVRMDNLINYLKGECHCGYYRGTIRHTCLPHIRQKPIAASNFLFTHDAIADADISGKIFITPAGNTYSFSDL